MLFDGVEEPESRHSESSRPVLGSIRGADVALVRAKKREPYLPAFAWEDALATAPLFTPAYVDEDMLIHAARLAISLRSASERDEAEGERVDDEEAAREARQVEADGAGEFRADPYHRVGTVLKPYHRADGTRRHSVEVRAAWFPTGESR